MRVHDARSTTTTCLWQKSRVTHRLPIEDVEGAIANDRAASLIGIPDEDIELRHSAFETAARALIDQVAVFNAIDLGRKAYQLLLEMHALGAPRPVVLDLPTLIWELKSAEGVVSASVMVMVNQWDFILNSARADGRSDCEQGHHRGAPRQLAKYIFNTIRRSYDTERHVATLRDGDDSDDGDDEGEG